MCKIHQYYIRATLKDCIEVMESIKEARHKKLLECHKNNSNRLYQKDRGDHTTFTSWTVAVQRTIKRRRGQQQPTE